MLTISILNNKCLPVIFLPSSWYNYAIISCKLLIIIDFVVHLLLLTDVFFFKFQTVLYVIYYFYFVLFYKICAELIQSFLIVLSIL